GNGSSSNPPGDVIVGGAETVDYILDRAKVTGEEYLPEQVHAVIETQLAYLREIGAIGPPAVDPPGAGIEPAGRSDRNRLHRPTGPATNLLPEKAAGPPDAR